MIAHFTSSADQEMVKVACQVSSGGLQAEEVKFTARMNPVCYKRSGSLFRRKEQ
jgi:hypothetical protein